MRCSSSRMARRRCRGRHCLWLDVETFDKEEAQGQVLFWAGPRGMGGRMGRRAWVRPVVRPVPSSDRLSQRLLPVAWPHLKRSGCSVPADSGDADCWVLPTAESGACQNLRRTESGGIWVAPKSMAQEGRPELRGAGIPRMHRCRVYVACLCFFNWGTPAALNLHKLHGMLGVRCFSLFILCSLLQWLFLRYWPMLPWFTLTRPPAMQLLLVDGALSAIAHL